MLKAARVHGRPIMVIAIKMAAITQPTAIQRPPNTIHKPLSTKLVTGIGRAVVVRLGCEGSSARGLREARARIKPRAARESRSCPKFACELRGSLGRTSRGRIVDRPGRVPRDLPSVI